MSEEFLLVLKLNCVLPAENIVLLSIFTKISGPAVIFEADLNRLVFAREAQKNEYKAHHYNFRRRWTNVDE